jgi:hypothetical protein
MAFPLKTQVNPNLLAFFKSSSSIKGNLKHDLPFRRRRVFLHKLRLLTFSTNQAIFEHKLSKFFKAKKQGKSKLKAVSKKFGRPQFRSFTQRRRRFLRKPALPSFIRQSIIKHFNKTLLIKNKGFNFGPFLTHKRNFKVRNSFRFYLWQKEFKPLPRKGKYARQLLAFNKFFQKTHMRTVFRALTPFNNDIKSQLTYNYKNPRAKEYYFARNNPQFNFFPIKSNKLLFFAQSFWPGSTFNFIIELLNTGVFSANNALVTNKQFNVASNTIIGITLNPFSYVYLALLLMHSSRKLLLKHNFLAKIKPHFNFNFCEFNFKTGEIFILNNTRDSYTPRQYAFIKIKTAEVLKQRFFARQKGFGLGRLL